MTVSARLFGSASAAAAVCTRPHRRGGSCRTLIAMFFVASLAACADGGPPHEEIGPPPGMDVASPTPETAPPAPEGPPPTLEGMPALENTPSLEGKTPSGFVEMQEVEIAFLGAAGGGTGTLTFKGQTYPFDIAGLGGGGAGISKIDASGEVYNLAEVAEFPGAYDELRSGVTLGGGGGDLWLQNNEGVIMHLKAETEGLMLSLGADAVDIRMSE